jgi:hypothetical protein
MALGRGRYGMGRSARSSANRRKNASSVASGAHVHGVADGLADDGVRAMDAPAEAVALRRGEQRVHLRVVEVLDVEPLLLSIRQISRPRTSSRSIL